MDASCKIQRSIHDVRLTYKYVSRILGTYQTWGGYFCVLLLSLPNVYPILKQVKPKLTTAMKSTILNGLALLSSGFPFGFLCNQRVTVPLEKD